MFAGKNIGLSADSGSGAIIATAMTFYYAETRFCAAVSKRRDRKSAAGAGILLLSFRCERHDAVHSWLPTAW